MENPDVEAVREREYPHMNNGTYLDHGGATIYTKSAVEAFTRKMVTNLYGNPHSENSPAKLSGNVVDEVREKTLHFLGADPEHYDLVFVANATAAIKLVADSFSDLAEKSRTRRFWYGYHYDAHTSLVGVRELARSYCFESDGDVEAWLDFPRVSLSVDRHHSEELGLFAYPAQSNMSGKRLPLGWSGRVRDAKHLQNTYTLLDAAAFAMTSPMELVFQDVAYAPDFTCLSLYKIFGFPDIGALVVRRDSGHILTLRKYFGGGTVTNVSAIGETWYRSKGLQGPTYKLHEGLEDGTLPFHSILALGEAIDVHGQLYKSMSRVSEHTSFLVSRLYRGLTELSHGNGRAVVKVYSEPGTAFDDPRTQGSVVAFNVLTEDGGYVPYTEVERRANDRGIYIRSGAVCNPGGIYFALGYEPWMMQRAVSAGHHCGGPNGISVIHRIPTGIVRASIGAMTTKREIDTFLNFIRVTFAGATEAEAAEPGTKMVWTNSNRSTLYSLPDEPTPTALYAPGGGGGAGYAANAKFTEVREFPRPGEKSGCVMVPMRTAVVGGGGGGLPGFRGVTWQEIDEVRCR